MGIGWVKNGVKKWNILRKCYKIHTQTTHNGGRPSAAPHKGGPAAFGGRPTFVGTIMGALCMYFITFSKYVPLFDPIFDPSYAHQDAEAPTS